MICYNQEDMYILIESISVLLKLSRNKMRIGVTSGCFDLLHPLHVLFLQKCAEQCDYLVVFIDSDELVRKNKNKSPMFCQKDRLYMVNSLRVVPATIIMHDYLRNVREFVEVFEGSDVRIFKNSDKVYGQDVESFGVPLVIIPDVIVPTSSTEIRNIIDGPQDKGSIL